MVPDRATIEHTVVEFGVLVAILLVGSVLVTSATHAVEPPASRYLQGVLFVGLLSVGIGWVLWTTDDEQRRATIAAGLGGGVGVIFATSVFDGRIEQAVGAGVGAMVLSAGVILWTRWRES